MATRPGAATRRALDDLIEAAAGASRWVDLELHLRRLTVELPAPVEVGAELLAGGVRLRAAAGGVVVPVVSVERNASAVLPDGTPIEGGGVLRAEVVVRAGGRWDQLHKRYDGPAAAPRVFDLVEAQIETARWFAGWLARWTARRGGATQADRDALAALLYGDRGGGKTLLGLWICMAACLAVPGAVVWVVSASRPQSTEDVRENLSVMLPREWASYHGQPEYRYRFVNNSRLREMTADSEEDLKQGDVDLAFLNEAAKMGRRAFTYTVGRVKLRSGLVFMASNPPTPDVPKGVWVLSLFQEHEDRTREGKPIACVVFKNTSRENAAVDQSAQDDALDLMRVISPRHADADALGLMLPLGSKIIHTWDRHKHGRFPAPVTGDITREWTRRRYGRAFDFLGGVDFQAHPFIIGSFWKLFGRLEAPVAWCVSDVTEQGSEDDFLDALQIGGIPTAEGQTVELTPDVVLFVGDSSAQWQDRKHRGEQARIYPPSFSAFKARGLHIVPPAEKITPEARWPKNPPVGVSLGQITHWIGHDRMHVSPLAKHVLEAFREAEAKTLPNGAQVPEAKYAHAIDTARYVAWYVEPPTRRQAVGGRAIVSVGQRR